MTGRANSIADGTARKGGLCLPVSLMLLLLTLLCAMGPARIFTFEFALASFAVSLSVTIFAHVLSQYPDALPIFRPMVWVAGTYTNFLGLAALFNVWGRIFDNGKFGSVPFFTDGLSGLAVVIASMTVGLCLVRHGTEGGRWTATRVAQALAAAIWSAVFATVVLLMISRVISGPPGGL